MARKFTYYALAVVLLIGSMAGVALADQGSSGMYGPAEPSASSEPETVMEEQAVAEDIRQPIETGALPEDSERVVGHDGWVNLDVSEQNSTPELRGLLNIQEGGGGD